MLERTREQKEGRSNSNDSFISDLSSHNLSAGRRTLVAIAGALSVAGSSSAMQVGVGDMSGAETLGQQTAREVQTDDRADDPFDPKSFLDSLGQHPSVKDVMIAIKNLSSSFSDEYKEKIVRDWALSNVDLSVTREIAEAWSDVFNNPLPDELRQFVDSQISGNLLLGIVPDKDGTSLNINAWVHPLSLPLDSKDLLGMQVTIQMREVGAGAEVAPQEIQIFVPVAQSPVICGLKIPAISAGSVVEAVATCTMIDSELDETPSVELTQRWHITKGLVGDGLEAQNVSSLSSSPCPEAEGLRNAYAAQRGGERVSWNRVHTYDTEDVGSSRPLDVVATPQPQVQEEKKPSAIVAREIGQPAPQLQLLTWNDPPNNAVQGEYKFDGQVTLLDFSASWCGPCQAFEPRLREFAASHPGIKVVTVYPEDPRDHEGVGEKAQKHPHLLYAIADRESLKRFGVNSFPTFVLVGRDGRIYWDHVGTGGEALPSEDLLNSLLSQ